jgi:hypothetical protein
MKNDGQKEGRNPHRQKERRGDTHLCLKGIYGGRVIQQETDDVQIPTHGYSSKTYTTHHARFQQKSRDSDHKLDTNKVYCACISMV